MKCLMLCVVCMVPLFTFSTDYKKALDMITKYQESYSDTDAVFYMLDLSKSDACPDIITHCMALYTLHAGSIGASETCLAAYQSALNRYPNAAAICYLKKLALIPDPCPKCSGFGSVDQPQEKGCLACNATGLCKQCKGTGKLLGYSSDGAASRKSFADMGCLTCARSGKCSSCGGKPITTFMVKVPCIACNGVKSKINASVAKDGLIRITQSFHDLLQMAYDCDSAYNKAIALTDTLLQAEALQSCLSKYASAVNCGIVKDKLNEISKKVEVALLQQDRQKREAKEQKVKDDAQKTLITKQHEALLYAIERTKTTRFALKSIQEFIDNNPASPLIHRAELLRVEFDLRLEKEEDLATQKRYTYIGGGLVLAVGVLAWLASCIRFK